MQNNGGKFPPNQKRIFNNGESLSFVRFVHIMEKGNFFKTRVLLILLVLFTLMGGHFPT